MEIRRICRFLILIFLVLALLFYYLYTVELKKRTVVSDELVMGAVKNISDFGIAIDESVIEKNMPERDIYYFDFSEKNEYLRKVSSSICKNLFCSEVVTTEFDTPEGFAVGIYDKASSEKELGRIIFSESELLFSFNKNGINMTDGDEPIENMHTEEISTYVNSVIKNVVADLTESQRLGYRITGSSSNETFLIITVMQTIDNSDIVDSYMNFVFQNDELVVLSGNWITESPREKYHNTLLDGVNVLYKLDLEKVASIESETIVYSLRKTDENKCFIIPCWKIKFFDRDGNLVTSYFDAL